MAAILEKKHWQIYKPALLAGLPSGLKMLEIEGVGRGIYVRAPVHGDDNASLAPSEIRFLKVHPLQQA